MRADLPPELWACVEPHTGVMLLTHPAESFLKRVESTTIRRASSSACGRPGGVAVVIDPDVRFGTPSVRGIPTEVLAEQVVAGDSIESVSADFDLELTDVIAALSYENHQLRPAA